MPIESMTTLDGILKNYYIGPVRAAFNREIPLYNRVKRDRENIVGRQAIFPVHVQWSEAVGAIGETDTIPSPGTENVLNAIVPIKSLYGRLEVSTKVIEATKSDAGAFVQAMEFKMRELTDNLKKELEVQLQGDGTGALAQILAVDTTNHRLTVDNPGVFRPGMILKAASARTGGTVRTTPSIATVTGVDYVTGVLQFASGTFTGTNWTVNDFLFRGDSSGNFVGRGINLSGLLAVVDDGTFVDNFHGIARSSYPLWKANVLSNAGTPRDLSLALLQAAEDRIWMVSGARPTALYSHLAQRYRYVEILTVDRRFTTDGRLLQFDGGAKFDALEYNGRPWFVSRECPKNVVYLLDEDVLRFFMLKDIGWMEQDGNILHRAEIRLAYTATLEMHAEFGTYLPNHHAVIRDLTVPTGY